MHDWVGRGHMRLESYVALAIEPSPPRSPHSRALAVHLVPLSDVNGTGTVPSARGFLRQYIPYLERSAIVTQVDSTPSSTLEDRVNPAASALCRAIGFPSAGARASLRFTQLSGLHSTHDIVTTRTGVMESMLETVAAPSTLISALSDFSSIDIQSYYSFAPRSALYIECATGAHQARTAPYSA